jgi:mRNA interferase RelE/StbE
MTMRSSRTDRFKAEFLRLSKENQKLAIEKFKLFAQDMSHPSLRVKKMNGYDEVWEGHVSMEIVFTFTKVIDPDSAEETIWFLRIGTHEIYKNPKP